MLKFFLKLAFSILGRCIFIFVKTIIVRCNAHEKGRMVVHAAFFGIKFSSVDQMRDLRRRPTVSKANPPTANRANVAGSGVVTEVLLMLVTKLLTFNDVAGLIAKVIVLITVNSPLNGERLAPTELYATADDGDTGVSAEFNPSGPESLNANVLGILDVTELLKSTVCW